LVSIIVGLIDIRFPVARIPTCSCWLHLPGTPIEPKNFENFCNLRERIKNAVKFQTRIVFPMLMLKSLLALGFIASILGWMPPPTVAQITPDASLGTEPSRLSPTNTIEGGARRGANLFHSFSQFNINEGQRIDFANPAGVDRILARVTGNTRSEILGTLGVLGNADLFLINPNGIRFGANAQLDLRGSFVASTADSLVFDNGFAFSGTNPQVPPLLTISVPVGLQSGRRSAAIEVQGAQLATPPGKTLALIGGDVQLENNAILQVTSGRLELGGLANLGTVELEATQNGFQLQFPESVERSLVSMAGASLLQATSDNGGSIAINAQTIRILEGSQILISTDGDQNATRETRLNATDSILITGADSVVLSFVNSGSSGNGAPLSLQSRTLILTDEGQLGTVTLGTGKAGDITIRASESVTLTGNPSNPNGLTALASQSAASGNGGNVTISTGKFILDQEAQLGTLALSTGQGGNVSITATDVAVDGGFLASVVGTDASGTGGNLNITTRSLRVTSEGQIGTNTDGPGAGGTLTIKATEGIIFDGAGARKNVGTGAFSRSGFGFLSPGLQVGKGGKIEVTTPSLLITNGANIDASAFKNGPGGTVEVNVENLSVLNGGQIGARTLGLSNAGTIKIAAANIATFDGSLAGEPSGAFTTVESGAIGKGGILTLSARTLTLSNGAKLSTATSGQGNAGNIDVSVIDLIRLEGTSGAGASGIFSNVNSGAIGNGGSIFINANGITMQQNAQIAVNSQGDGQAGSLGIRANTLSLSQGSRISAETTNNQGGDILLDLRDLLLLRQGSQISTTAGTANAGGDGGNMNITAGFIVAVPNENSDITANAFSGRGGNITITTQGIFGIDFRDRQTALSDITASSQFGINGIVTINTLALDPIQGTSELPTRFSSPPIAQGCQASSRTSRFVNQGRGGVSPSPADPLVAETIWQDWELIDQPQANHNSQEIVEVRGWIKQSDGTVALVTKLDRAMNDCPSSQPIP
jgi:filamentous hemagglutinin family protein